jgi:hypothetical protein
MAHQTTCHCGNLRDHVAGTFDWADFDELSCVDSFPGADVDCKEYTLRCKACGSKWRLTLDQTPVMPAYDWSEIKT